MALEIEKARLERLDGIVGGVIACIERIARERVIETFLVQHRAFSALNEAERQLLVRNGSTLAAARGEPIFKENDPAGSILILRTGSAKLVQVDDDKESILAYFSSGDVVGMSDGKRRGGDLIALDLVEFIRVDRELFDHVTAQADARITPSDRKEGDPATKWSDQLNKALNVKQRGGLGGALSSKTSMMFVEQFLGEGAQVAQSLLTIDLDLCVRCGNCVVACESRHGYAKMTRRGKKLVRRREEALTIHQPLLLPSSCRHCESPECMIGCPTGAIHRKPTGEVAIHDFCIGCSNCALRCPWDNITMISTPGRWALEPVSGMKLDTPKIASKCDLCAGYDEANCVNNCPTKAILRVEPSYFPEVRAALGETHRAEEGRTVTAETKDRSKWVIFFITLVLSAPIAALWYLEPDYTPWSKSGIALGIITLVCMVLAGLLSARKRLRRFPGKPPHPDKPADPSKAGRSQLGPYYLWTRAHVAFGMLAFVAMIFHGGFTLTGGLITSLLAAMVLGEVALGLSGIVLYRWLPKVISRLEKDAQVPEDVDEEHSELLKRREEVLAQKEKSIRKAAKKAARIAGGIGRCLSAKYEPDEAEKLVLERLEPVLADLDRVGAATVRALTRDAVRLRQLEAVQWMYRTRRAFISTHIAIGGILLLLTAAHVFTALFFYLRLG